MGRSQENAIESYLETLLVHLLKWAYQPDCRCGSWRASIREARFRIRRIIKKNPSLCAYPGEYLAEAYEAAKPRALDETGLVGLPATCPWLVANVLEEPETLIEWWRRKKERERREDDERRRRDEEDRRRRSSQDDSSPLPSMPTTYDSPSSSIAYDSPSIDPGGGSSGGGGASGNW